MYYKFSDLNAIKMIIIIWNCNFFQTGARIVIHSPEEWPLIDEFGIDISPGTYTLAAITEVSLNNGSLIEELEINLYLVYIHKYIYLYWDVIVVM